VETQIPKCPIEKLAFSRNKDCRFNNLTLKKKNNHQKTGVSPLIFFPSKKCRSQKWPQPSLQAVRRATEGGEAGPRRRP
jgi:hypothetical protein